MNVCKRMVMFLVVVLLLSISTMYQPASAQSAQNIRIFLDGQEINSDVSPYVLPKVNLTLVPLRVIIEGLGAAVDWNQTSKSVTITWPETAIAMTIGQKYALVNGNQVPLDASVDSKQGRVMVPLRFVGEQLGLQVNWDQKAYTISLLSAGISPQPGGNNGNGDGSNNGGSQDLKAAWVSTIYNLDWPSSSAVGNSAKQQQEYINLLDELQGMGLNSVFVQVRPSADAFYISKLVPWSKYISGASGKAPDYDPLAFMIEETHKRGMTFHAWFNPFRANTDTKIDKLDSTHVTKQHPEWIVQSGNLLYINPGIPEARQHIIDTIMEVVDNYDIDGVHLDDYFYPSNGVFNDDVTFRMYNNNHIATIPDWRRDNINEFVRQLGETIHRDKPQVSYGISPFGVWRNKAMDATGSDTKAGVTAYDNMYADVRAWITHGWIDYVAPQIYWSLSFSAARYDTLVDWWSNEVKGTKVKLYIGHSPYKLGTTEAGWQNAQEIINQLKYNKLHPEVSGDLFFSAKDLRKNPLGLIPALQAYYGQASSSIAS
ncbi:hypothetical protein Back11_18910 [Paenibacillus baekrokdamisoli]|uniref:Uncharacterized protein n=1 Tax=Paenibacillus baekrokdamisoli TaxID=1712516 RepID=A0A3G9IQ96_9BACL|nr:family 10 glycosylhydrolase [Paenibacillus baekrokdamisoli]MBB3072488.1 uncharacterized lipoprotein YddW (UPF0748 family) [Paenibacillus baekrokdamisoli]BBH20546.1 hypothetical protein Back11_18910 [Paenibacillus baekrokdamisoli]